EVFCAVHTSCDRTTPECNPLYQIFSETSVLNPADDGTSPECNPLYQIFNLQSSIF
ncbi:hypothetical protein L9F63_022029, partial [Diploptera punctata]